MTQKAETTAPFALHWGMSEVEWEGEMFADPSARRVGFVQVEVNAQCSHLQHGEGAAGRVARRRCSLWHPGCRKVGAKAGPAFPRWSDPVGAPSRISPGSQGRQWGQQILEQAASFGKHSLV